LFDPHEEDTCPSPGRHLRHCLHWQTNHNARIHRPGILGRMGFGRLYGRGCHRAYPGSQCLDFGPEGNHRREEIVPTSPEYVTESLETVMRHGFDGAVLSWNIMEAPDSHIACLKKHF
jgi:hypothetical protein